MTATRAARISGALVVAAAVLLLAVPQAFGHAAFLGSDPAPGVRLAAAPAQITMTFTEPLNRRLARAELHRVGGGRIAVRTKATSARRLVVVPVRELPRGAYRIRWHSVSTQDGHALEGMFSFGVRTAAAAGGHVLERSPLARSGWARVGARILLYVTLLLFAGALLLRVLLPTRDGSWLTGSITDSDRVDLAAVRRRERTITTDLGVGAASAAVLAALLEAADAAGGLDPQGIADYLLANVAGAGRVAVIGCTLLALVLWQRWIGLAATFAALALGAVAASGHAGSAAPRLPSILNDWGHLVAGAIWLGGVALIVLVWTPAIRRGGGPLRRRVSRDVLPRFGLVALPAFVAVITTGTVSLLLQLGEISDLWSTAYGRVLTVKIALVAVIAALSWWHAVHGARRALDDLAETHASAPRWRVLRAQPLLGVAVLAAVALLATFPLPPRQLADADATVALPACNPCPLPRPTRDELAVADRAGRYVVAGWLRRDQTRVTGTIRVLDYKGRAAAVPVDVRNARQRACGRGCARFSAAGNAVEVSLRDRGRRYAARLPALWERASNRTARRLLSRAQQQMRALRSLRQVETITSGPGTFARTRFRLRAPDRLAYSTDRGIQSVVIGRARWLRAPDLPWQRERPESRIAFSTRSWFRWSSFAQDIRLLRSWRRGRRRFAELALMDPGTPVWLRLTLALDAARVVREQQTSAGRFVETRYSSFDQPVVITPPRLR